MRILQSFNAFPFFATADLPKASLQEKLGYCKIYWLTAWFIFFFFLACLLEIVKEGNEKCFHVFQVLRALRLLCWKQPERE